MDCILISSEYPYLNAEPFLENEIDYLCTSFDMVYIFSINAKEGDEIRRPLPQNTKCFPLGGIVSKSRYFFYLIEGLQKCPKELAIKTCKLKKALFSVYVRGRALDTAKKVLSILENDLTLSESVVVYSYWFTHHSVAAWLVSDNLRKRGLNVVAVSRAHGYDLYENRNQLGYLPFQDVMARELDGVYPCSDNGSRYLKEKYPEFSHKIHTAYLGTRDYGVGPVSGKEYTNEHEWVLMTCCICKPLKRLPLFAEAFVELCKSINAKWICIGDGPDLKMVKSIILDHGLEDRVHFMGMVSNNALMEIYRTNHISYFCNVSTVEGLPVSIMEAFSFGVPAIATNVGGTSELVSEKEGRLIEAEINCNTLSKALKEEMTLSEQVYKNKRVAAREKWMAKVSAEKNYSDWCNTLMSIKKV